MAQASESNAVSIEADLRSGVENKASLEEQRLDSSLSKAFSLTKKSVIEGDIEQAKKQTMRMSKAVRRLLEGFKESGIDSSNPKDQKYGGNLLKIQAQGLGSGSAGEPKKLKKETGDKPKEGDVVENPEIKIGRGNKVDVEDDPDIEKDKEDELGGEDEEEYKETSNTAEDKVDTEAKMKEMNKKVKKTNKKKEKAKNLAEVDLSTNTTTEETQQDTESEAIPQSVVDSTPKSLSQDTKKPTTKKITSTTKNINLKRLAEIENQVRMITKLIPQIKNRCKRSALVTEIAPILEEALEKFMDELQKE